MDTYKVFNGVSWVDICECDLHIYKDAQWVNVDPNNCEVRYFDGENWCLIDCNTECLDFLPSGNCGDIPQNILFAAPQCSDLFGTGNCARIVFYIPVVLTSEKVGISLNFSPGGMWDGLDVIDVCNQRVVGGLGMLGNNKINLNGVTQNYTKKAYYDFNTSSWVDAPTLPDVYITFSEPNGCIYDTPTVDGYTTGYQQLSDPLPSSINQMYLTRKSASDFDICSYPTGTPGIANWNNIDYRFERPAPPPGGYPPEEVFIIRVISNPATVDTSFQINFISCIECIDNFEPLILTMPSTGSSEYIEFLDGYNIGKGDFYTWLGTALPDFQVNFTSSRTSFVSPYAVFDLNQVADSGEYNISYSFECDEENIIDLPAPYQPKIFIEEIDNKMYLKIDVVDFDNYIIGDTGGTFCIYLSKTCPLIIY